MKNLARSIVRQVGMRLRGRLGYSNEFYASSVEKEEICGSEFIGGYPAKVLPGQFDRVTGAAFGVCVQGEIDTLNGKPRRTKSTNIYRFRDVLILKSWVIPKKSYEIFGWPKQEWSVKAPTEISTATLISSFQGCRFFGHWLRDDCATSLLFGDNVNRISIAKPDWADAAAYDRAFLLPASDVVENVFIGEMFYCDDIYQNSHKAKRFKSLRERLRQSIDSTDHCDVVYIGRGPTAKTRKFLNERDLIDVLERRGVKIVFAESLSSADFIANILNARIIISVEGSQISHALYALRENKGGVIAIQPPDRLFTSHLDWARTMDIDFGTVVGIKREDGFVVPPEDVLRTIDLF